MKTFKQFLLTIAAVIFLSGCSNYYSYNLIKRNTEDIAFNKKQMDPIPTAGLKELIVQNENQLTGQKDIAFKTSLSNPTFVLKKQDKKGNINKSVSSKSSLSQNSFIASTTGVPTIREAKKLLLKKIEGDKKYFKFWLVSWGIALLLYIIVVAAISGGSYGGWIAIALLSWIAWIVGAVFLILWLLSL